MAVSAAITKSARSLGDCFPFFRRGDADEGAAGAGAGAGAELWLPPRPRFGVVGVFSLGLFAAARFADGGETAVATAAEVDEDDEDDEEDSECFSRSFRIAAAEGKSPVLGKS